MYHGDENGCAGEVHWGRKDVITRVDGYETEYTGEYHGLMTIHNDVPGVVSQVTGSLAEAGVNIAYMRLYREKDPRL